MQDRFTPARLSPRTIQPLVCGLPFGLTWDDLAPCLPGLRAGAEAVARRTHAPQGLHREGASQILTVDYLDDAGVRRSRALFIKQCGEPGRAEAAKHRYLSAHGVATPQLLRAVSREDVEVIVLEFLPTIGIEPVDADELLTLIATLNCVTPPPSNLFAARPGQPESQFEARVEAAVHTLAGQLAGSAPIDPAAWLRTYRQVRAAVSRQPRELNHGELYFQQVGRTDPDTGARLVVFDLETTALLPRFTDVASILAGLAETTGRTEGDLFERYLAARRGLGAEQLDTLDRLDKSSSWRAFLLVRVLSSFEALPWVVDSADAESAEADALADTPRSLATRIRADLDDLAALG